MDVRACGVKHTLYACTDVFPRAACRRQAIGRTGNTEPCESLVCQVELSWQGSEESEPPSTRAEGLRAAAEHFTTALAHGEAQGLHHIQSEALIHLARISYLQRQPAEALGLLRKHLDLSSTPALGCVAAAGRCDTSSMSVPVGERERGGERVMCMHVYV